METLTTINGNDQVVEKDLPRLVILGYLNDTAIKHIAENTGLNFIKGSWGNLEAQPTTSKQIASLFVTYNFKTRYYDNWDIKNTIMLKHDHHIGFDVSAICGNCAEHNRVKGNWDGIGMLSC